MDVYRTEEEQIEAIKGWWKKNTVPVVAGVALAIALYGGWNWYRNYQLEQSLVAAALYQSMMQSLQESEAGGEAAADAAQRFDRAAGELLSNHGKSTYALFAALMQASVAVGQDDLPGAEKALRRALEQKPDEAFRALATDRLARVVSAQGRHDEALKLLDGSAPPLLGAGRSEIRGDILFVKGDRAGALEAWRKARAGLPETDPARVAIDMKIDYAAGEATGGATGGATGE